VRVAGRALPKDQTRKIASDEGKKAPGHKNRLLAREVLEVHRVQSHPKSSPLTWFAICAAALYFVTTSELLRSVTTSSSPAFTSSSLSDMLAENRNALHIQPNAGALNLIRL
jgi:hypothetical protein